MCPPGFALPALAALALLALLALPPGPAQAASATTPAASACEPDERLPLDAVLALLPACQGRAQWLAWVGDRLNRAGRPAEAAEHLERALMLDPDALSARLGYVLALAASGDTASALAFAQELLRTGRLPSGLAGPLAARVARWQTQQAEQARQARALAPPGPWRTRLHAGARLGYESNPLGAPDLDRLTLLIGGQPVTLPLDGAHRRRGSSVARADLGLDATLDLGRAAPGLRGDLGLLARHRAHPAVSEADLTQVQGSAEISGPLPRRHPAPAPAGAGWYGGAWGAAQHTGGGQGLRSAGVAAGLRGPLAPWGSACQLRAGAEAQRRIWADSPLLSGRYSGLAASLHCDGTAGSGPVAWQLQVARGTERPDDPARPGGAQQQALLRLSAQRGPWQVDAQWEWRQDATAYSPLLGPVARDVRRTTARVAHHWRLPTPWAQDGPTPPTLTLGLEWSAQRANLELFRARGWGLHAGLRQAW